MGSTYVLVIKYIKNRGTPFQGQQLPELRLVQMPTQFAQHLENAWGALFTAPWGIRYEYGSSTQGYDREYARGARAME